MIVKSSHDISHEFDGSIDLDWIELESMVNFIVNLREKSDDPKKQILLLYIESELKRRRI